MSSRPWSFHIFFPEKLVELKSRDHINFMSSSTLVNDITEKNSGVEIVTPKMLHKPLFKCQPFKREEISDLHEAIK